MHLKINTSDIVNNCHLKKLEYGKYLVPFFPLIFSENLKPLAAEDRRIEEEEKKVREQERIAKAEAEGNFMSLNHVSDIQSTVYTCIHLHAARFTRSGCMKATPVFNIVYLYLHCTIKWERSYSM